jgi:hypothetical protein
MDQSGSGFLYLKQEFLRISKAKSKEQIQKITEIMRDSVFDETYKVERSTTQHVTFD